MRRRYVLGGLLVGTLLVAAAALAEILATVFIAVTVAYLLAPVARWLVEKGLSRRMASFAVTLGAVVAGVCVVAPLVVVPVLRVDTIVAVIRSLPPDISLSAAGLSYTLTLADLRPPLVRFAQSVARSLLTAIPVLGLKASVFVLLTFALVRYDRETSAAVVAVVPPGYRDVASAVDDRIREILLAIYVLQAATAVGTFFLALPVFVGLGYPSPVALSTLAGLLQFLPVIGPSVLLVGLALFDIGAGNLPAAVTLLVVGGLVIALLPDVLIRPRLARMTADIPGSLYFVGFVGGLLSLGAVGIVAGPLAVGLVVELADLLAAEIEG